MERTQPSMRIDIRIMPTACAAPCPGHSATQSYLGISRRRSNTPDCDRESDQRAQDWRELMAERRQRTLADDGETGTGDWSGTPMTGSP